MTAIDAVKHQIELLAPAERAEVARWLDERDFADWDAQIRQDHADGKLDDLIKNARAEAAAGKLRDLPT